MRETRAPLHPGNTREVLHLGCVQQKKAATQYPVPANVALASDLPCRTAPSEQTLKPSSTHMRLVADQGSYVACAPRHRENRGSQASTASPARRIKDQRHSPR